MCLCPFYKYYSKIINVVAKFILENKNVLTFCYSICISLADKNQYYVIITNSSHYLTKRFAKIIKKYFSKVLQAFTRRRHPLSYRSVKLAQIYVRQSGLPYNKNMYIRYRFYFSWIIKCPIQYVSLSWHLFPISS